MDKKPSHPSLFIAEKISDFSKSIEFIRGFMRVVDPAVKEAVEKTISTLTPKITQASASIKTIKDDGKIEKKEFELKFESVREAKNFLKDLEKFKTTLGIPKHLLDTSLVSLISYVEVFISQITHFYFNIYPQSITSGKEKKFSFDDLEKIGSIEDAKSYLIGQEVEQLLWGSIEDWAAFFKKRLNLEVPFLDKKFDEIKEIFLRRNLLVHNGGVVNSTYLKGIKGKTDKALGDRLSVNKEYLDNSFTLCEIAFSLVALEMMTVFQRNTDTQNKRGFDNAVELLNTLIVDHLQNERYLIAEHLSKYMSEDNSYSNISRTIALVNYWQAVKWQGRFEEIEKDVRNTDISGMLGVFSLAKHALLNEYNDFFKLLPECINTKNLDLDDLKEWPLFKEIRELQEYSDFLSEMDKKKPIGGRKPKPTKRVSAPRGKKAKKAPVKKTKKRAASG